MALPPPQESWQARPGFQRPNVPTQPLLHRNHRPYCWHLHVLPDLSVARGGHCREGEKAAEKPVRWAQRGGRGAPGQRGGLGPELSGGGDSGRWGEQSFGHRACSGGGRKGKGPHSLSPPSLDSRTWVPADCSQRPRPAALPRPRPQAGWPDSPPPPPGQEPTCAVGGTTCPHVLLWPYWA